MSECNRDRACLLTWDHSDTIATAVFAHALSTATHGTLQFFRALYSTPLFSTLASAVATSSAPHRPPFAPTRDPTRQLALSSAQLPSLARCLVLEEHTIAEFLG